MSIISFMANPALMSVVSSGIFSFGFTSNNGDCEKVKDFDQNGFLVWTPQILLSTLQRKAPHQEAFSFIAYISINSIAITIMVTQDNAHLILLHNKKNNIYWNDFCEKVVSLRRIRLF